MLACDLKLAALAYDLVKQTGVLKGDHCLIRERLDKFDLLLGEWQDLGSLQNQRSQEAIAGNQRHAQAGTTIITFRTAHQGEFRIDLKIKYVDRPPLNPTRDRTPVYWE